MSDLIKIAVDAMGGDGSPKKVIDGIILNHSSNKNNFFKIFGDKNKIYPIINGKIPDKFFEIIHTENKIESTDSPLGGAKRGKDTSMWLAIQSVKNKETDIVVSAGNNLLTILLCSNTEGSRLGSTSAISKNLAFLTVLFKKPIVVPNEIGALFGLKPYEDKKLTLAVSGVNNASAPEVNKNCSLALNRTKPADDSIASDNLVG